MANCQNNTCQNNMRYMRRPMQGMPSSAPSCARRMDGCPDTRDFFPEGTAIAMAYVPWQKWQDIYEPCKALEYGTIFQELNKPFLGKGGRHR